MTDTIQETPIESSEEVVENSEKTPESVKSFLGEENTPTNEDNTEVVDTTETEEKPQEEPVLDEKEVPEEPSVPLEEIAEEIKNKTKEEVNDEILKALGMSKEEKEIVEEAGYKFPWEQRGEEAPKDWKEVVDAAIDYQNFKKEEEDKVKSEAERQQMAIQQEREEAINLEWDSQLDYLREQKLIPDIAPEIKKKISEGKMLTLQEREDAGLKAQAGIFETMYKLSVEREKQGLSPITDVVHIFNRYYEKPKKPAGADAPVSGGSIPIQSNEDEDIPYEKLRNATFEDLVR
jgi:hypothetical protein